MTTTISDIAAQSGPSRAPAPGAASAPLRDGRHDFDFLHGTWRIHNRRLRNPLTGSADWYEFEGRSIERPLWASTTSVGGERCCPVIELRQYTLRPGRREVLIDLFDREFVETQEASGMTIVAQFRDIDRPDVFTWIRGFPDMPSRAKALESFYFGPVWARHREAANATMISSDNVRLMHPARSGSGFAIGDRAFVWFARFEDVAAYDRYERELVADRRWTAEVRPELDRRFAAPVEIWRLRPTARSRTLR
jgi:hypothetical protein